MNKLTFLLLIALISTNSCSNKNIPNKSSDVVTNCLFDLGNIDNSFSIGINDNLYRKNSKQINKYFKDPKSIKSLYVYDNVHQIEIQFFPQDYHWIFRFSIQKIEVGKINKPYIKVKKIENSSNYYKIKLGDLLETVRQKLSTQNVFDEQTNEGLTIVLNNTCAIENKYYSTQSAKYEARYFFENGILIKMKFVMFPL